MELGRRWFRQAPAETREESPLAKKLKQYGRSDQEIAAWIGDQTKSAPEGEILLPERLKPLIELWRDVASQWRTVLVPLAAGMTAVPVSRAIGLDLLAVKAIAEIRGQKLGPQELKFIQCLEAGALEQMNSDSTV